MKTVSRCQWLVGVLALAAMINGSTAIAQYPGDADAKDIAFFDPFTRDRESKTLPAFGWTGQAATIEAPFSVTPISANTLSREVDVALPPARLGNGATNPPAIGAANREGNVSMGIFGGGLGVSTSNVLLYYTPASPLTVDITPSSRDYIAWTQFSRKKGQSFVRAAVKVDGKWFVSNTGNNRRSAFNTTGIGGQNDSDEQKKTALVAIAPLKSTAWLPLQVNLTDNNSAMIALSQDATVTALPSGSLEAFGWYVQKGGGNIDVRLDNFTVAARAK